MNLSALLPDIEQVDALSDCFMIHKNPKLAQYENKIIDLLCRAAHLNHSTSQGQVDQGLVYNPALGIQYMHIG